MVIASSRSALPGRTGRRRCPPAPAPPKMRTRELRYRLLQNGAGIVGSAALIYSVCSPHWYGGKGLWHTADLSQPETQLGHGLSPDVETERVFGVIASMMAVTAISLCLLFIFCWDPDTCSESKVNPGRMLHPGKLLLVILMPTALLYLISWCSFTSRHKEQIRNDITKLGSGYWMGICSWFTLLVILPIIYLIEQCTLPEPETSLNKSSREYNKPWNQVNLNEVFPTGGKQ